jgi:putative PIN family toxin of toxin-antitoxin system
MRVVLDTNVLVSGLLNPHGAPGRIVEFTLADAFVVLYDDRIFNEYRDVLSRPELGIEGGHLETILDYIMREGEYLSPASLHVFLPDPTDLPFLEVAVSGRADALVTGNARHFKSTRGRPSVNVCSPADFLRRLAI